jgi:2-dehydro-3-deoxygluconokinase
MYDIVTVGEGMLRLSPPRNERIRRAKTYDVHICGSQGNIAANTARLGLKSAFVTKLPDIALGLLMKDFFMSCGADTSHIQFIANSRLGVNYIEFGGTPRSSMVVYDRKTVQQAPYHRVISTGTKYCKAAVLPIQIGFSPA